MARFDDALRGYAFEILKRDGFKCRYCGLDGTLCFDNWLTLSWDHLLPEGHALRDDPRYIVASCNFCNCADNHYFRHIESRGLTLDGLTPDQLVEQRRPFVLKTRDAYRKFWEAEVAPLGTSSTRSLVDPGVSAHQADV